MDPPVSLPSAAVHSPAATAVIDQLSDKSKIGYDVEKAKGGSYA